jgi:hypothetical protein
MVLFTGQYVPAEQVVAVVEVHVEPPGHGSGEDMPALGQ